MRSLNQVLEALTAVWAMETFGTWAATGGSPTPHTHRRVHDFIADHSLVVRAFF